MKPYRIFAVGIVLLSAATTLFLFAGKWASAKNDKDKTPPVIMDLRTEPITDVAATVRWTTDEPADSDIKYGVAPKTNVDGPSDAALVLDHAIALAGLTAGMDYAFCVGSRDAANNKADACGTFTTATTTPEPPPHAANGGIGGNTVRMSLARISGFAPPGAKVLVELRGVPFGERYVDTVTAGADGSFTASFSRFPWGIYFFSVIATDTSGVSSARKGFQFDFRGGDAPLFKEAVLVPPTLSIARGVISWGDDILATGSAPPDTGVLVEAGGVAYEAQTDSAGHYQVLINTARFSPGKISLRARSALVSALNPDYSLSKTVTLTRSLIPAADLNKDGRVDMTDLSMFMTHPVDMNGDGVVDIADISVFLSAFTKSFNQ